MTLESRAVIFVGPSLSASVRRQVQGDVIWCPPAGRGDLAELDQPPGTRIVLVDGYMIQRHPPSPTEVFDLIERGYEVWGCSSLGALRAAELRHHGMCGHGWVYERIVDGTITYDDELVAPLDPRTGEATALFMANIRFGLDQLVVSGYTTDHQAKMLLARLRDLHFAQRTRRRCHELAIDVGLKPVAVEQLLATDVKRHDAETLIGRLTASPGAR
ncbi:TfuA-like protein [Haloechinothrix halophila]|uniref:TfuA-like protein n=1 Tax=Haloechinothrix halophila TaxID=1069073 RepID=UPI00042818A6|nr:TfuA-like protein [Haloechinothrix halophila]